MAFRDFPMQEQGVRLLQRSLERGRLGHAYLFAGHDVSELAALARTLAKVLNCQRPSRSDAVALGLPRDPSARNAGVAAPAIDCCDRCPSCLKIDHETHADVHWIRPESKLRVVTINQMRDLMHEIHLKPTEAEYKVGVIVAADRLNVQAANAFLKTLEEPPPRSVLILLTTEPQRLLETILSRCLRLNFAGEAGRALAPGQMDWLRRFGEGAAADSKSLIGRYRLLGVLAAKLAELKEEVEKTLKARSPLTRYEDQDVEPELREQWEKELAAAIEAEYRLRRADLLAALQMWFREVWLRTQSMGRELLCFPDWNSPQQVARRISPKQAMENLQVLERTQRLLGTNVQEALALEVGLLKLWL